MCAVHRQFLIPLVSGILDVFSFHIAIFVGWMITRETIDQIFSAARVEEVIGEFVTLKKSGSNFKALSPFSDEKTPSFMVSPAKQIWKDFSSGKGGNVVTFLMEHEHYSYPEALRYLAQKYGIEIREAHQTPEQREQVDARESLYIVTEFASQYFQQALAETAEGKAIGLAYFRERGFTKQTIERFALGYCPDRWDAFTNTALKRGYQLEFLEETGLTITRENGRHLDRFRGRVLFPVQSFSGRILGFGGRVLKSEAKLAKYINSPESPIYHKSAILYGIFQAKKAIIGQDNCYLVEGYTDVLSLHQRGVENVVASSGTALTPAQIRLIRRLSQNLTILFDGDAAGIKAALKGVDLVLEQGMNVRVLLLPEGQDPDTFARSQSTDGLRDFLKRESQDFIQFKARLSASQSDPLKRAEAIRDVLRSIAKIDDFIKRELYVRETATIFGASEQMLFSQLHRLLHADKAPARNAQKPKAFEVLRTQQAQQSRSHEENLERALLRLLLLYGAQPIEIKPPGEAQAYHTTVAEEAIHMLTEDGIELQHPVLKGIFERIKAHWGSDGQWLSYSHFVTHSDPEVATLTSELIAEPHTLHDWERRGIYVPGPDTRLSRQLLDILLRYKRHFLQKQLEALQARLQTQQSTPPTPVLQEIMEIKALLMELDQLLSRVV